MILRRGEYIRLQSPASYLTGTVVEPVRNPGVLYLTNARLAFEVMGPLPYTAFDVGITEISNVHASETETVFTRPRQRLTIESRRGRAVVEVQGARDWADSIVKTIAAIPPPPPPHPAPPPPGSGGQTPVVVNVQAAAGPKIMMHCRNCGNLYDATKGRCDKCGAPPT
jgi:hypothetical protein